jgi:hypothetical protein
LLRKFKLGSATLIKKSNDRRDLPTFYVAKKIVLDKLTEKER